MKRRDFLKVLSGSATVLLAGRSNVLWSLTKGSTSNAAAARRELSQHRIANIEARQLRDQFPRLVA